ASSMTPSAPAPPATPSAFERGRRRFLANDLPGAIEAFEEAARTQPRNAQVHKQLGRAYMRSGDVQRAHRAYRRYLELAPSAPDRALVESMLER
ncbi:MAG TPA: tetratricopeptide repeat protein, partial [Polyangiaceae bacterium LLY-WYZ-15_(1-7)]|nr:tetratricopeptide repeat protein [Polyangiaceae bacterium LLY-WYZ-15_(1-7)]